MNTACDPRFELKLPALPPAMRNAAVADLYKQGFVAERTEKFDTAASCFEEVHRREPNNPYVLLDLARVYFQMIEIERAKSVLLEAIQQAGNFPDVWYQIGLAYQDARLDPEAERCFQLARNHAKGDLAMTAALIGFYESRGMLKQAQAVLERVRRKRPNSGLITALKGVVLLRSGDRAAAIEALKSCMSELPERHSYQINVRYVLARALAETGQEGASLEYLRQAKAQQETMPEIPRFRQVSEQRFQAMHQVRAELEIADIRADWRAEAGPGQRPLVFLLGYPRSGTTLLEQVVESHSEIHSLEETGAIFQATRNLYAGSSRPDETPWDRINSDDTAGRRLAREWYFEYLHRLGAAGDPSILLMDKNPAITGHVSMISRMFPEAKLLFVVRDPRDICLSAYQTNVVLTPFSVNWLRWPDTVKHCMQILEHWVAVRDRLPNPYLEVRYEDLLTDLPQTGRRVMEFLGLEWEPQQEDFVQHARSKQVYSPTHYDVRQGLNQQPRGKWRRFAMDYAAGQPGLTSLLQQYGFENGPEQNGQAAASQPIGAAANRSAKIAESKINLLA